MRDRMEQQGFALRAEVALDLPTLRLDADALTQAIMNLLDNAMKYSGERKDVLVTVKEQKGEICIAVQDAGQGIGLEDQQKIFQKFYQVGDALKSEMKGVGLGLAIVQYMMEAHGGRVEVQSTLGVGSTFSLILPVEDNSRRKHA